MALSQLFFAIGKVFLDKNIPIKINPINNNQDVMPLALNSLQNIIISPSPLDIKDRKYNISIIPIKPINPVITLPIANK